MSRRGLNWQRCQQQNTQREVAAAYDADRALMRDSGVANNPLLRQRLKALLAEPLFTENLPLAAQMMRGELEYLQKNLHCGLVPWRRHRLYRIERRIDFCKLKGFIPKENEGVEPKHPHARPWPTFKVRPEWMKDPNLLPKSPPKKVSHG